MGLGHRRLAAAWATGALLVLAPGARAEEVLRASGTGTVLGTLKRLSAAFAAANPGYRLDVLPSVGSSGAISAVAKGGIDFGISGRPLEPGEQGRGVAATAYARTPFVFAVGPATPVYGLTAEELVRIYRGELTSWPNGERIRAVLRPRTDVDTAILRTISPDVSAALDAAYARQGLLVALTNQECDEILARTPGAIGPTSLAEILTEDRRIVPLAWNGVVPTVASLASGAYPIAKTLYVVTRVPVSPAVERLLAFLRSPEGRKVLEGTGNLPISTDAAGGGNGTGRR